ncbi:MAG TPA: histone-like nucleoid-structuring protein Lsr2 [Acidimicrobiales bacterium]|nr:histone-like nucleoid-structuring protein Lsr2 [Acidimicrobiales bacterium]
MARQRQIIETVTCDVCGEETDDPTGMTLGWGREQWELDLCPTHNAELSQDFERWTANARRASGRGGGRRSSGGGRPGAIGSAGAGGNVGAVREWAKANGYQVGEKGRIAADVRAAYAAANPEER